MSRPFLGLLGVLVLLFSLAVTASVALVLRVRAQRRLVARLAAEARRARTVYQQDDEAERTDAGTASASRGLPAWRGRVHAMWRRLLPRLEPVAQSIPVTPHVAGRLLHAGFETSSAPLLLRAAQASGGLGGVLAGVLIPLPQARALVPILVVVGGLAGTLVPLAWLDRQVARRQRDIQRGLPDALDLLVVCVEAGVSLEMAIQRVGRELGRAHRDLASELIAMSRRLAAGVPREQAFQGLHARTGVEELRMLATHLIQSERWGTSLATVLRSTAQELRRRRRRAAEQRAATAATRMLAPLALCIFPTIFVVILGPAALRIASAFRELAR